jgi:hypothetical protein
MADEEKREIVLIPVDENGRVLLFSDVKVEPVDRDYRTIRDKEGLTWKLQPGDYTVKVFLRDLQIKSVPLTVSPDVSLYQLEVPTQPAPAPVVSEPNPATPIPVMTPKQASAAVTEPVKKHLPAAAKTSDPDLRKRFPASFPVSYRLDSGKWVKAKALNVSASGICVENFAHVTIDDNLYVKLHVPIATIPIECPARVVWVMSEGSKIPCMGLQLFLTANMRESLDRWLSGI